MNEFDISLLKLSQKYTKKIVKQTPQNQCKEAMPFLHYIINA